VGLGTSISICALVATSATLTHAQVRGVYPLGMNATGAGLTPGTGFTYSNVFLFYSRDDLRDADGRVIATGQNAVLMDMNSVVWVSPRKIGALGGATFSVSATLPISNNSLTSDLDGAQSGGGGLADSYYQPAILAWTTPRADVRVLYGFLAPTGRFSAGANDNVGSGYWTHVVATGQTFYPTSTRRTAVSAFQMYEFHGTQPGTDIHPGQTLDLDYSIVHTLVERPDLRIQAGLVGYGQWQTSATTGPTVTAARSAERYRVNALGFAANVTLPLRKVSLGARYFWELSNRSTFQGYSLQISGALTL
jgi:hypothetical protein